MYTKNRANKGIFFDNFIKKFAIFVFMKITFDTETDSTDDLKNALDILNGALQKKGVIGSNNNAPSDANSLPKSSDEIFNVGNFVEAPKPEQFASGRYQVQQQPQQQQKAPEGDRTSGGGRVVEFRDLSGMMSNIFSNQSTRRTK